MPETRFTRCYSPARANRSDAITDSYNRTKDLFTLCCSFVPMVLDYDVTIKVLGFLIEGWCGMERRGGVNSSDVLRLDSLCVNRFRTWCWCTHKREIRWIYIFTKDQNKDTHTYRDSASHRFTLIFLLLCRSFNHNKAPLPCWPLCVVFERGWHARTQTLNAFPVAAC